MADFDFEAWSAALAEVTSLSVDDATPVLGRGSPGVRHLERKPTDGSPHALIEAATSRSAARSGGVSDDDTVGGIDIAGVENVLRRLRAAAMANPPRALLEVGLDAGAAAALAVADCVLGARLASQQVIRAADTERRRRRRSDSEGKGVDGASVGAGAGAGAGKATPSPPRLPTRTHSARSALRNACANDAAYGAPCVCALLSHVPLGVDVDAVTTAWGATPLALACVTITDDPAATAVRALLARGASATASDDRGLTPTDRAMRARNAAALSALEQHAEKPLTRKDVPEAFPTEGAAGIDADNGGSEGREARAALRIAPPDTPGGERGTKVLDGIDATGGGSPMEFHLTVESPPKSHQHK